MISRFHDRNPSFRKFMSKHYLSLREQYNDLYEYISTITWIQYEEAKKRGKDYKGYYYFFGRTLHRLLHPLYFFHQKNDPQFLHEQEKFDPANPEEKFTTWEQKKAFLTLKFREKRLEIYSKEFTQNVLSQYDYQVIQWLIKNHYHKIYEFDPYLSFYLDIVDWSEEDFHAFFKTEKEIVFA